MAKYGPIVLDDTSGKFVITSLGLPNTVAAQIVADLTPPSSNTGNTTPNTTPSNTTPNTTPTNTTPSNTAIIWKTVANNDWTSATTITLNGKAYYSESAQKPYSQQISQNTTSPIVRCEVRNNELWTSAMGGNDTERSELDGSGTYYNKGSEFWFAYQFMIEPGADQIATGGGNPGGSLAWGCIGQIHGNGSSAAVPWQLSIQEGFLSVRTQQGAQVEKVHWTSPTKFERNRVYDVVVKIKITATTASTMSVWIDGVLVVSSTGFTIGGNDPTFYVKCGIYRGWQGDGYPPFAVQIANIEQGTGSLLSRTTTRKAWPTVK